MDRYPSLTRTRNEGGGTTSEQRVAPSLRSFTDCGAQLSVYSGSRRFVKSALVRKEKEGTRKGK